MINLCCVRHTDATNVDINLNDIWESIRKLSEHLCQQQQQQHLEHNEMNKGKGEGGGEGGGRRGRANGDTIYLGACNALNFYTLLSKEQKFLNNS